MAPCEPKMRSYVYTCGAAGTDSRWYETTHACVPTVGAGLGVTNTLTGGRLPPNDQLTAELRLPTPVASTRCQSAVPLSASVGKGVATEIRDVAGRASTVTVVFPLTSVLITTMEMVSAPVFAEKAKNSPNML